MPSKQCSRASITLRAKPVGHGVRLLSSPGATFRACGHRLDGVSTAESVFLWVLCFLKALHNRHLSVFRQTFLCRRVKKKKISASVDVLPAGRKSPRPSVRHLCFRSSCLTRKNTRHTTTVAHLLASVLYIIAFVFP